MTVMMKPQKAKVSYDKIKEVYAVEFKHKENWLLIFGNHVDGKFSVVIDKNKGDSGSVYSLEMTEVVVEFNDDKYFVIFGEYKGENLFMIPNHNFSGRLSEDLKDFDANTKILEEYFDEDTAEIMSMAITAT